MLFRHMELKSPSHQQKPAATFSYISIHPNQHLKSLCSLRCIKHHRIVKTALVDVNENLVSFYNQKVNMKQMYHRYNQLGKFRNHYKIQNLHLLEHSNVPAFSIISTQKIIHLCLDIINHKPTQPRCTTENNHHIVKPIRPKKAIDRSRWPSNIKRLLYILKIKYTNAYQ